jgi:hypothetical protein
MRAVGEPIPAPASFDAMLADADFADGAAFIVVQARQPEPACRRPGTA